MLKGHGFCLCSFVFLDLLEEPLCFPRCSSREPCAYRSLARKPQVIKLGLGGLGEALPIRRVDEWGASLQGTADRMLFPSTVFFDPEIRLVSI